MHFILSFIHLYITSVTIGVKGFGNETNVHLAADFILSITDFIGEVILIYRCWLLWSRKCWVIMFPSLCAIGGLACACALLLLLSHVDPNSSMEPPFVFSLAMTCLFLPLGANVVVTILIAARIWYLSPHNISDLGPVRSRFGTGRAALGIIIESGMLYLAVQLTFVVLFTIGHPAQDIALAISVQIYGIAPALIIIRVALGLSNTDTLSGNFRTTGGPASRSKPSTATQEIPVSPIRPEPSSGGVVDQSIDVAGIA